MSKTCADSNQRILSAIYLKLHLHILVIVELVILGKHCLY